MRWNTSAWNWRLKKNHGNTSSRKYLLDLVCARLAPWFVLLQSATRLVGTVLLNIRLFHAHICTQSGGCFMLLRTVHSLGNQYGNTFRNRTETNMKLMHNALWWGESMPNPSLVVFGADGDLPTSYLMVNFWLYVSKWQLVCKYGIVERNFPLILVVLYVLYITHICLLFFLPIVFYTEVILYAKYCHNHIDVVSAVS